MSKSWRLHKIPLTILTSQQFQKEGRNFFLFKGTSTLTTS